MANMICDVCGTSYPAADDKCPNCGYSRAIAEQAAAEEAAAVVRERVPGGRFSRKNVLKRIKAREEAAEQENTATLADLSLELGEAVAAADFLTETVPEPEPVPAEPQPQPEPPAEPEEAPGDASEIVMDWPILEVVAAEQTEEPEVAPVLFPEMPEAEEDEPAADEPAEEEAQGEDSDEEVPDEEVPVIPVILPGEAETEPDTPDQVQPEAEKKKKALIVNIALIAAAAIFLLSLLYLAARYGIPFLQNADRPGYSAVETTEPTDMTTEPATDAPTDPPTEAPTDPPTEPPTEPPTDPPTDPPTEPPTDPPTEPPTEAPTDPPPLEIPLTLNYYELTFRGRDQGVQMEVEGYRNADITWTSDDPSVATVTENGKIISVGPGTTVIHATYRGHTVSCKIKCMF